jgi:hypothetical protein
MHELTSAIYGCPFESQYQLPSAYTGELFGVKYLYKICDPTFKLGTNIEEDIDRGFTDDEITKTDSLISTNEIDFDPELEVATSTFLDSDHDEKEDEAPSVTTDFKSNKDGTRSLNLHGLW